MRQSFNTYNSIEDFKSVFPYIYSGGKSDSFFMAYINESSAPEPVSRPFSFEGIILLYSVEGKAQITVDHERFEIEGNSVVIVFPGALLAVHENFPLSQYNLMLLAVTLDTIDQVPFDFKNVLPTEALIYRRTIVRLDRDLENLLRKQISLANSVSDMGVMFANEISKCMFSVVFLMLVSAMSSQSAQVKPHSTTQTLVLVSRFVQLLKDNYRQHRDIGFYSERLGVTTNYLSQRLKSASGRNATTWIDSYLLSESKKMLLFTSKSVQAISDELNFSSQAAFAKYFKEKTGMTPTLFRQRK